MAKKVGADVVDPRISTHGAPAPADNAVVTEGSFLTAVKEITAATLKVKLANEARKNTRKKWKASGIVLGPLDTMVKMAEWARGEVRDHFSVEKQYATWLGLPVEGRQTDAFKGLGDDEIQAREWNAAGRTASRTGKQARPPEECPEEFHQAFMRGFNEEDEATWAESEQPDRVEAPPPTTSLEAAAEPTWSEFPEDHGAWSSEQRDTFEAWFAELPAGELVTLTHPGAIAAFQAAVADEAKGGTDEADIPRLAEPETADQRRNRIFNEGVAACRANEARDTGPYEGADGALWLDGWDHQVNKELSDREAAGETKPAAKKSGKPSAGLH